MIPEREPAFRPDKPVSTPAEDARDDIIALMQEAKPRSPQARAIYHIVRWFGAALPREQESGFDHHKRRERQQGRIQAIINRNIERSAEYETERDYALFLIEAYACARGEEIKGQNSSLSPGPKRLQTILAQDLKDMKTLAKANSAVVFTTPVTENPSK